MAPSSSACDLDRLVGDVVDAAAADDADSVADFLPRALLVELTDMMI